MLKSGWQIRQKSTSVHLLHAALFYKMRRSLTDENGRHWAVWPAQIIQRLPENTSHSVSRREVQNAQKKVNINLDKKKTLFSSYSSDCAMDANPGSLSKTVKEHGGGRGGGVRDGQCTHPRTQRATITFISPTLHICRQPTDRPFRTITLYWWGVTTVTHNLSTNEPTFYNTSTALLKITFHPVPRIYTAASARGLYRAQTPIMWQKCICMLLKSSC